MNSILVTGSSGFIGSALVERLRQNGHRVVPLRRGREIRSEDGPTWNPPAGQVRLGAVGPLDAVVHLAGENIARRWSSAAKARIRASRVDATRLLCGALALLPQPPRVLVCASATGIYGDRGDELLDENSAIGTGFLAELCQAWEEAAQEARQRGIRVVHLRIGIVLSGKGGPLARMVPAFGLGLGARLGTGRQYWSWILLEDLLRVVELVLQDDRLGGVVNAVSPEPTTNAAFTQALGQALHQPAFLAMPSFAVKLIFGQMGREALLASARVHPTRLTGSGFEFRSPHLDTALKQALTYV